MRTSAIVFVAYQNQESLGVGYLSSMLLSRGYNVEIVNFGLQDEEIFKKIRTIDPFVVGFSLIFQYHSFRLRDLVKFLRVKGIDCHFTVGGHFPSLRYEQILRLVPGLDSVVRFEGEFTMCELAKSLSNGDDWRNIEGLAYREEDRCVSNSIRPLIDDLDKIPFPFRGPPDRFRCMEKNYTHILASRGCVRNCSFCSVRKFYGTPPGRLRRTRSPENVVKEMRELYQQRSTAIFLFQDDDFIFPGSRGKEWISDFIEKLNENDLSDRILWKISCRPDEVEPALFKKMQDSGLFLVYLGIESGNETGLKLFNKQMELRDSLNAVKTLKQLGLNYEFGFMMFDPTSTFNSLDSNLAFLKEICGDGSAPIVLGKTIPLAETDIEKMLKAEGRLIGSIIYPDYRILDLKLNYLCDYLHRSLQEWMFSPQGMLANLRWHRFEYEVVKKYYPNAKDIKEYGNFLQEIIFSNNSLFFEVVNRARMIIENGSNQLSRDLDELTEFQHTEISKIKSKLYNGMVSFQKKQS